MKSAFLGTLVAVVLGWRLIGSPIEQLDRTFREHQYAADPPASRKSPGIVS